MRRGRARARGRRREEEGSRGRREGVPVRHLLSMESGPSVKIPGPGARPLGPPAGPAYPGEAQGRPSPPARVLEDDLERWLEGDVEAPSVAAGPVKGSKTD